MKNYRIVSKGRFITFAMLLSLIIGMACVALFTTEASSVSTQPYQVIEVKAGDTLWDIARTYLPEQDVRRGIYAICQANDMTAGELQAGQQILVPVTRG